MNCLTHLWKAFLLGVLFVLATYSSITSSDGNNFALEWLNKRDNSCMIPLI